MTWRHVDGGVRVDHMDAQLQDWDDGGDSWFSTVAEPPPENLVVQVQNNQGALLLRQGRLWFLPDRSMYVYYTPKWWRPAP